VVLAAMAQPALLDLLVLRVQLQVAVAVVPDAVLQTQIVLVVQAPLVKYQ
jgi:hypothetical protein